jgi:small subunit ribosomal protein S16
MLAIRMQRAGRKGHAQFRVVVQDSRFNPKSGRVVAYVGSYDPHTKAATLDSEKVAKYLENGAQPSERVARLLQKEGVKLPKWATLSAPKKRDVRNADKRRSTRPAEEAPAPAESPAETSEPAAEASEPEVQTKETPSEDSTPDAS